MKIPDTSRASSERSRSKMSERGTLTATLRCHRLVICELHSAGQELLGALARVC